MRLCTFVWALFAHGLFQIRSEGPLTSASHCMMQVEVPARGRISSNGVQHEVRYRTKKHSSLNGHRKGSEIRTQVEKTHAEMVGARPQLQHAPRGDFQSALVSLWNRCHLVLTGKGGPEGPMLGILMIVASGSFFVFAAFTLAFRNGSEIRSWKEESQRAVKAKVRTFMGPSGSSGQNLDPPRARGSIQPPVYRPKDTSLMQGTDRPVAVVDSHPPREFETPAYMMSTSQVRHPANVERDDSKDNIFPELAEEECRSLGYNFDSMRRFEVMAKLGGSVPADRTPTVPPSSDAPLQLPALAPPQYRSMGADSLKSSAPRSVEYRSMATSERAFEAPAQSPTFAPVFPSIHSIGSFSPGDRVSQSRSLSPGYLTSHSQPPAAYHSSSLPSQARMPKEILYRSM